MVFKGRVIKDKFKVELERYIEMFESVSDAIAFVQDGHLEECIFEE